MYYFIYNKINTYIGLTTMTLWRHLTLHISDTISQHLKIHSCLSTKLKKNFFPENTSILHKEKQKKSNS